MADNINTKIQKLINYGNNKFGLSETTMRGVIDNAQVGGGADSGGKYLIQVIDFDGTILKQDHLNTGDTFNLPEIPTHEKLVFQEWSAPIDIANNTIIVGNSDITIGATYTTASGLSEFDITLTKATGLSVTLNIDGVKYWGDGTSDMQTTHTYAAYGDYTITCNGTSMTTSSSSGLFGQAMNAKNYYCTSIRLSNSITRIGAYAFHSTYSLTSITIPRSVTSIGSSAFQYCCALTNITIPSGVTGIDERTFHSACSLTSITIPSGVTSIDNYALYQCYSLTSITIPRSVTSIGSYAFHYSYLITKLDFSTHTSVPTMSSAASIDGINEMTKIIVPDNLYNNWIVATNWTIFANFIYKASGV